MSGQASQAEPSWATSGVAASRASARGENFPVATFLIPPRHRRHLMALYSFARRLDDIGDEAQGDRSRMLDSVTCELDRLFSGEKPTSSPFRELATTVGSLGLPREPFDKLIEANRQDQVVSRYRTFAQLQHYCELSANPVGELVLGVFGADRADRRIHSDKICTALQLLEHSQDVAEDYAKGRVYLPAVDLARFAVAEAELAEASASRRVRALVGIQVQRAVAMLDEGAALLSTLHGPARLAVAGYLAGGHATAEALAQANFDVLATTPRPSKAGIAVAAVRLLATGAAR